MKKEPHSNVYSYRHCNDVVHCLSMALNRNKLEHWLLLVQSVYMMETVKSSVLNRYGKCWKSRFCYDQFPAGLIKKWLQ